jgi:predicted nucleic acid-binding protein
MSRLPEHSTIVLDASVAIAAMFPIQVDVDVLGQLAHWLEQDVRLVAPDLFLAECTSAVRKLVHANAIRLREADAALDGLFAYKVAMLPITPAHCRAAFAWAERLGQSRIYDGLYLAVAEEVGAELWTADRRLANAARQVGVGWVRTVS